MLPWEQYFWITTIAIGLDWQKNNFACVLRFFVHFLAIVARLDETS